MRDSMLSTVLLMCMHAATATQVLERIKQGYQYLLPSICVEIFSKEGAAAGEKPYGVVSDSEAAAVVCVRVTVVGLFSRSHSRPSVVACPVNVQCGVS